MSGYVSFVTEFGVLMAVLLGVMVVAGVVVRRAWSRGMLCWLVLVAYLYVQFEAYAFYALALVVWGSMHGKPFSSRPSVMFHP